MKKITLIFILILVLGTSLVKNSTKKIEDKIFTINDNIGSLKVELGEVMLESDYLSSPEKLLQYKAQYFEKDLIKIDILQIKKISKKKNNFIEVTDFIEKIKVNE
jgi:hypothetical protein|tara:strand:+ start:1271 stop:1585 length:315 start_codon:yes stop_codon:yes gene_type:complete